MKKISQFLKRKDFKKTVLDEKTVFYIFNKIVKKEYGEKGSEKIKPKLYKNGKIFVKAANSNWANEIWMNKEELIKKLSKELETKDIRDIKMSN